ncbi:MAG TPA: DUF4286 family protein [Parapedobacter sp.]|uniref:DUF4286 family protein n=1 Tax=Parapedobacter sp. TaxID=1958893 RepID=UPI002BE36661|nr:DUF4286 family protein [Parapedobacter sp.]HWK59017.1 DUF4286 family protein [Parapedobacter sp.]
MYLYNVTIIVENDIRDAVKQHLDAALFRNLEPSAPFSLLELLDSPHEGATYCVQLRCNDRADIIAFQTGDLASLQTGLNGQYPGKVVFFDSIMKYLNN